MTAPVVRGEAPPREGDSPASKLVLWVGVLTGPLVALSLLEVNYVLVPWSCAAGPRWPLHATCFVAALVVAGAGYLAWQNRERAGGDTPDSDAGTPARSRFLGAVGVLSSTLFLLVVLAQWLTIVLMGPCQRA